MRLQSWRGTSLVQLQPRRSFPWVRLLIVALVLGIAVYLIVPNISSIRADAQVRGDLIPVTPVYRARIDRMLVNCTGLVRTGQPVAVVSNFLIQADYQRQYLQALEGAQIAGIALEQNVATARENAESMHEKYEVTAADEKRLEQSFHSYDAAYKADAINQVDWEGKRSEILSSQAQERSALDAWKRAELFVSQIVAEQNAKAASYQSLAAQAQGVAQRMGQETLRAPVSGDIVECIDRPQNVIEPGTPIFSIFQPDRAYVVAYFNPDAVSKVHVGQSADVSIAGLPHSVVGRVGWIYPNLDALPPDLTRFFWQHVQFSQYRPVKILLDRLPEQDRQQVYYGAQARVTISLGCSYFTSTSFEHESGLRLYGKLWSPMELKPLCRWISSRFSKASLAYMRLGITPAYSKKPWSQVVLRRRKVAKPIGLSTPKT
jgi:membrane fusion protein (multidrug efflux system)